MPAGAGSCGLGSGPIKYVRVPGHALLALFLGLEPSVPLREDVIGEVPPVVPPRISLELKARDERLAFFKGLVQKSSRSAHQGFLSYRAS
jgi:hypothetical protein